ncbi:MAG: hypothetical protein AB7L91_10940 [Dehalococcoidia bacterium]
MPRRPTTRGPLGRRSLPPSPTYAHAPGSPAPAPAGSERRQSQSRPARIVEREAPYLLAELRRIALVTGTCIGMLVMLVVVDRLQ